jgi:hypothetical protein
MASSVTDTPNLIIVWYFFIIRGNSFKICLQVIHLAANCFCCPIGLCNLRCAQHFVSARVSGTNLCFRPIKFTNNLISWNLSECVCVCVCVCACTVHFFIGSSFNQQKHSLWCWHFFLLVTLLHVSMRKHHHQGVSLFIRKNLDLIDRKERAFVQRRSLNLYRQDQLICTEKIT